MGRRSRRCAVLGSPIAHSLSPVLHAAAYAELGLKDWRYDAYEVDEAGLPDFLTGLEPGWCGLSLTMPLKRAAIPLCDVVSDRARLVAAVNTIVPAGGRLYGTNTDVPGIVAALHEHGVEQVSSGILVGVGATAGSALAGLAELGARSATAFARDPARAGELRRLASDLGVRLDVVSLEAMKSSEATGDVLVSTVPESAAAAVARLLVGRAAVVFDVLYEPWPTGLAVTAEQAGRTVVGGLDLLVHQAALQVELMTGRRPAPLAAMRAAGERALATRCRTG